MTGLLEKIRYANRGFASVLKVCANGFALEFGFAFEEDLLLVLYQFYCLVWIGISCRAYQSEILLLCLKVTNNGLEVIVIMEYSL
ncbi:unnamed protein product [Trifolium pratense]|nr:unnamed protein product [Trifolium pratense]